MSNRVQFRFSDLEWFKEPDKETISIVGLGGIGSWVAFFLGRIGYKLHLIDFDTVEAENLGGQLYSIEDIGRMKASAMGSILGKYSDHNGHINLTHRLQTLILDQNYILPDNVIMCVDNMEARKFMFEIFKERIENNPDFKGILIDGRMLAESFHIFVVHNKETLDRYEKTLFEDDEAGEVSCSQKATTHCGAMIGSNITACFTNFMSNKIYNSNVREVPFSIETHIDLMIHKVVI